MADLVAPLASDIVRSEFWKRLIVFGWGRVEDGENFLKVDGNKICDFLLGDTHYLNYRANYVEVTLIWD